MAAKHTPEYDQSPLQYHLISTNEEASLLFERIAKSLETAEVGFDMEADDIGNCIKGTVSLMQIKIRGEPPYVLDIYGSKIDLSTTRFNEIMKSEQIEKIIHDPRNDSKMLHHKYKTEINTLFDPQSFHMTVMNKENNGETTRRLQGKRKSLDDLYEKYVQKPFPSKKLKTDMKTQMKNRKKNPHLWLRRPLTREMTLYAALDVETLIPLRDKMEEYQRQLNQEKKADFTKTYHQLCLESIYPASRKERMDIKRRKETREIKEVRMLFERNTGIKLSTEEKRLLMMSSKGPYTHDQSQTPTDKYSPKSRRRLPQPMGTRSKQRRKKDAETFDTNMTTLPQLGATCEELNDESEQRVKHCGFSDRKSKSPSPTRRITSHLQDIKLDESHSE